MIKLNEDIVKFFQAQGCVLATSIDRDGFAHASCKGIINIERDGKVYLLDSYRSRTLKNIKANPRVSVTAFDEHKFVGYCLKGIASVITKEKLSQQIVESWENKLSGRISQRLIKNIQDGKSQNKHPEAILPGPKQMIVVRVKEVVDLATGF